MAPCRATPFSLAPETLRTLLPKRPELTPEDEAEIQIPDRRYEQIKDAIAELFRKVDVKFVPVEPMSIAQTLGLGPVPYRSLGRIALPALLEASPDALSCWMLGKEEPMVFYNDRKPAARISFTIMHEIGHVCLGHREHSKLAEKEANFFASNALCPLPVLERSGHFDADKVAECFAISQDCARNRMEALSKWKLLPPFRRYRAFENEMRERLVFKRPIQLPLFTGAAS